MPVWTIMIKIVLYVVGLVMIGRGFFNFHVAFTDDDLNAKNKAIRYLVVGETLIAIPVLLTMTGIINATVITMI